MNKNTMMKFIITITTQFDRFNIIGINEEALYYVIKAYYNKDNSLKLGGKTYNLKGIQEFSIHEFVSEELLDKFLTYADKNKLHNTTLMGTKYFDTKLIEKFAKNVSMKYLTIERENTFKQPENQSEENQEILDGINQLLERLAKLELGQEVIYEDLRKDIEEVKNFIGKVSKKTIRQLVLGKIVDAGLGAIASETLDAITESGVLKIG